MSFVVCISTAKNLDANLFLIPFAETLGARHDDIRLDKLTIMLPFVIMMMTGKVEREIYN